MTGFHFKEKRRKRGAIDFEFEESKIILNETISKTGAINSVTATVFDFRGYDTLGEAIVLFTAICGVATVLRVEKKVKEEK